MLFRSERPINLQLFFGKELITRALVWITWIAAPVIENVVVLVTGQGRLQVDKIAQFIGSVRVRIYDSSDRTVRPGSGQIGQGLRLI